MERLSEDIVTEILFRLPVIYLIKCLRVCKDWYGLIKSRAFVDGHFNHPSSHKNRRDFIIFAGTFQRKLALSYNCLDNVDGALLPVPISAPESGTMYPTNVITSGPCNGIFCIIVKFIPFLRPDSVILCNPATRKSRRLPERPSRRPPAKKPVSNGISTCGFGFDPVTNQYKVVSVLSYKAEYDVDVSVAYRIGVYNLSSDSWREVETALPAAMRAEGSDYYKNIWQGDVIYFNGHLHWGCLGLYDMILSFDLTNEVVGHIPLPPEVVPANMVRNFRNGSGCKVMVLEDGLAMAAVATTLPDGDEACSVFVWKMMDYGSAESWTMRFSISIPVSGFDLHPLSFWKDDTLLLLDRPKNELVSVSNVNEAGCRVKTQKIDKCSVNGVVLVKESLVPLTLL